MLTGCSLGGMLWPHSLAQTMHHPYSGMLAACCICARTQTHKREHDHRSHTCTCPAAHVLVAPLEADAGDYPSAAAGSALPPTLTLHGILPTGRGHLRWCWEVGTTSTRAQRARGSQARRGCPPGCRRRQAGAHLLRLQREPNPGGSQGETKETCEALES